jgi:DNA-binding winged helix-turn-helix (wHTH) protein
MLVTILTKGTGYCPDATLLTEVWGDSIIEPSTVDSTKSHLQKKLKPLGVRITKKRKLGCRIQDDSRGDNQYV